MINKIDVLIKGFPGTSNRTSLGMSSVTLISADDKNILIDTASFGARGILINELKKRNLSPLDIDMVLFTHLHFDHCANADLFKNAKFVYSKQEWKYVNNEEDVYVQKPVIDMISKYDSILIDDNQDVISEIKAYITPGHTPGCTTYVINYNNTLFAVAGDAIKNRVELFSGDVVMTYDKNISKNSIFKIKNMVDKVIPGHDCILIVEDQNVIPEEDNILILTFQEGLNVNNSRVANMSLSFEKDYNVGNEN